MLFIYFFFWMVHKQTHKIPWRMSYTQIWSQLFDSYTLAFSGKTNIQKIHNIIALSGKKKISLKK